VKNESIIHMTSRAYTLLKRRFKEKAVESESVFTNEGEDGPINHAMHGIRRALERAGIGGESMVCIITVLVV